MSEKYSDVEIIKREYDYLVCRNGKYFKLGNFEGELLENFIIGNSLQEIADSKNISVVDIEKFIAEIEGIGIIGKEKKEKKNILFFKVPLIEADHIMLTLSNILHGFKDSVVKLLLVVNSLVILAGIIGMSFCVNDIFSLKTIQLPVYQYIVLYVIFFITVALHEMAHGIMCRYFGGRVGKMGFMLMLFQPAFYCDISGVRLIRTKWQQVITAFAGVYVNLLFMSVAFFLYKWTGSRLFGVYLITNLSIVLYNLIPLAKLDGYWMLSFATNITNLFDKSRHGIALAFHGKTKIERFIGVYGILTYGFIICVLGMFAYNIMSIFI